MRYTPVQRKEKERKQRGKERKKERKKTKAEEKKCQRIGKMGEIWNRSLCW